MYGCATSKIWRASSRVGLTITAPTCGVVAADACLCCQARSAAQIASNLCLLCGHPPGASSVAAPAGAGAPPTAAQTPVSCRCRCMRQPLHPCSHKTGGWWPPAGRGIILHQSRRPRRGRAAWSQHPAGEPAPTPPHLHRCGRLEALLLHHSQHLRAQPQACPAARHWAGRAALHVQWRRCASSGGSAGAAAKVGLRGPGWHTARLPRHELPLPERSKQVEAACRARDSGLCACAQRSEPARSAILSSCHACTLPQVKANERNGKLHASGPHYVARPDRSFQPFQQLANSSVGTAAEQNGGHRLPLSSAHRLQRAAGLQQPSRGPEPLPCHCVTAAGCLQCAGSMDGSLARFKLAVASPGRR